MHGAADADVENWVLTTEEGQTLLSTVEMVASPGPADLHRWREIAPQEKVAAALRIAENRRRGAIKFARANEMWFERTGLEQATAEAVARHKAKRFAAGARRVVDLCCGIGGDTIALGAGSEVLAVDADHGMARRTLWNAGVYGLTDRVAAVRAKAETFGVPRDAWVHVDPDRRTLGGRSRDLIGYRPDVSFLLSLVRTVPAGAFKLGPASDFSAHFDDDRFEVELISLGRECKEATVWFGDAMSCHRRATSLPTGVSWTDQDGPADAYASEGPVSTFVFDPDPALIRACLLDGFATARGLSRFVAGVDFLTGPIVVPSPFLTPFEVVADLPLDMKRLKREVAARQFGHLEIKTRGTDLRPEEVRTRLRTQGDERGVVLLAVGRGGSRAILGRRVVAES